MEAFAVAPASPHAGPPKSSPSNESNSGESSFAPILARAVNDDVKTRGSIDTSSTSEPSSHLADNESAARKPEKTPGSLEEEDYGVPGSESPDESILPFGPGLQVENGATGKLASLSKPLTFPAHFLPPPASHAFAGMAETDAVLKAEKQQLHAISDSNIPKVPADQGNARMTAIPAALYAGNGPRSGNDKAFSVLSGTDVKSSAGTFLLQNSDSITWSRGNQGVPLSLLQNNPLLPAAEIPSGQPLPSLSAEKMFAGLVEIPAGMKNEQSLRDNTLSLRREMNPPMVFESYIQKTDSGETRNNSQQFLGSGSETVLQNTPASSMKSGEGSQESSFSQSLNTLAGDRSQSPGEVMRPGVLPFTQSPHENTILQQITQKFRVSSDLQDSKMVLKLHPAELGSLKIDIQLKDGTISANILAQSQNVLEILERNLPRLRVLMEQQGLSVEEIAINLDSDMPAEHNLFEDQLSRENSFSNSGKSRTGVSFALETEVDGDQAAEMPSQSGVNVKV